MIDEAERRLQLGADLSFLLCANRGGSVRDVDGGRELRDRRVRRDETVMRLHAADRRADVERLLRRLRGGGAEVERLRDAVEQRAAVERSVATTPPFRSGAHFSKGPERRPLTANDVAFSAVWRRRTSTQTSGRRPPAKTARARLTLVFVGFRLVQHRSVRAVAFSRSIERFERSSETGSTAITLHDSESEQRAGIELTVTNYDAALLKSIPKEQPQRDHDSCASAD